MNLNKDFWSKRYKENQIGWDTGAITTPLKEYIDQLTDKNCKILIPGAGNSYEAEYLHNKGFKQVFVLDLAKEPLDNLLKRVPSFPKKHLLQCDFFDLNQKFDLVIEQTFYCALNPELRDNYVKKMYEIIRGNGKITGLLFQFPLTEKGPPFGGSKQEYIKRFSPYFELKTLETAYNSIKPRVKNELFIIFEKK
ncbi:MAG TPA: SAM-dependent methyltransferase [Flavobacteriaceae bacterium]|nr:SAM-dependent methyltransferase [Flavobacteriaceae bacterium]